MEVVYDFTLHQTYENCVCALHGDRVILNEDEDKEFRKIVEIKERKVHKIAGILLCDSKIKYGLYKGKLLYLFKPHNRNYPDFYVPSKYENETHKKYAYIEFREWNPQQKCPIGIVCDYIGNVGSEEAEYTYLRYIHDIQHIKEYKIDQEKLDRDIARCEALQKEREEYQVYSIDPIGCKDIDDAFHFRKCKGEDEGECEGKDEYEVGIHISYVWKYFEKSKVHFDQFAHRVSTLYMKRKNMDMIPKEYSTNLGSLLEKKKRYTLSILYKICNGRIQSYKIKECIVYVVKNYDYDSVDQILKSANGSSLSKKEQMLCDFMKLSQTLFPQMQIKESHKLVEAWMIQANCTMANVCVQRFGNRALLRVQNGNGNDKDNEYKENFILSDCDDILMKFMKIYRNEGALYQMYQSEDAKWNHHAMIQSEVGDQNTFYTHYTSPIRRFCDMYMHALFTETLPEDVDLEKIVHHMNDLSKRFRKFGNQSKILDLLFTHIHQDEYQISTFGYILEWKKSENAYIIYFPELGFTYKKHYHDHRFNEITEVIYDEECNEVQIKCEETIEVLRLYEKYAYTIYLFPTKYIFQERILVKRVNE